MPDTVTPAHQARSLFLSGEIVDARGWQGSALAALSFARLPFGAVPSVGEIWELREVSGGRSSQPGGGPSSVRMVWTLSLERSQVALPELGAGFAATQLGISVSFFLLCERGDGCLFYQSSGGRNDVVWYIPSS